MTNNRLTKEETQLLLDRLDWYIFDVCAHLNPDVEGYCGRSMHDDAERSLALAISAREKLMARLPGERRNPLWRIIVGISPVFLSFRLRRAFARPDEGRRTNNVPE